MDAEISTKVSDRINEIDKVFTYTNDAYNDSNLRSLENNKYMNNECYTDQDIAVLDKLGKPHLSYNMIFPTINTMKGNEQVSRKKIIFKPQTQNDEFRAEIVSSKWNSILEEQSIESLLQDTFVSGLINDSGGWIEWSVDYDSSLNAEFYVKKVNTFNIMPEPNSRQYDLSDCNYIIKKAWMTLDELKNKFPDVDFSRDNVRWFDKLIDSLNSNYASLKARYYNKDNDKYLVVELQKKEERVCSLIDYNGKIMSLTENEISEYKIKGYKVLGNVSSKRIRKTITAPYFNRVLLYDKDMPYPFPVFDVIPFFAQGFDNDHNNRRSMVSYLIDMQNDINKAKSQHADAVSSIMSRETVVLRSEKGLKDKIESSAGDSNVVYEVNNLDAIRPVNRGIIDPNILNRSLDAINMINLVSQINSAMRGNSEKSGETGVLYQAKLNMSSISINQYYDNLSKTRKMLAQIFADLFPFIYFEKNRILSVKDEKNKTFQIIINADINGMPFNDMTNFSKNLVVVETDSTLTKLEDDMQKGLYFANLLISQGISAPWDLILESTNLANKEEWIKRVQEQMGIQSQNAKTDQLLNDTDRLINQEQQLKNMATPNINKTQ